MIKVEIKKSPEPTFTVRDVRPGDRFQFGVVWYRRLKDTSWLADGAKAPGCFPAYSERTHRIETFEITTTNSVQIEGRSPPKPALVAVGTLKAGTVFTIPDKKEHGYATETIFIKIGETDQHARVGHANSIKINNCGGFDNWTFPKDYLVQVVDAVINVTE